MSDNMCFRSFPVEGHSIQDLKIKCKKRWTNNIFIHHCIKWNKSSRENQTIDCTETKQFCFKGLLMKLYIWLTSIRNASFVQNHPIIRLYYEKIYCAKLINVTLFDSPKRLIKRNIYLFLKHLTLIISCFYKGSLDEERFFHFSCFWIQINSLNS